MESGMATLRTYQYQTSCFDSPHMRSCVESGIYPRKGEWVLQEQGTKGFWLNVDGPYATEALANDALAQLTAVMLWINEQKKSRQ